MVVDRGVKTIRGYGRRDARRTVDCRYVVCEKILLERPSRAFSPMFALMKRFSEGSGEGEKRVMAYGSANHRCNEAVCKSRRMCTVVSAGNAEIDRRGKDLHGLDDEWGGMLK